MFQCRTQHFMWCNLFKLLQEIVLPEFQCRTQHYMWCNLMHIFNEAKWEQFQCRTQHYMWCNEVFIIPNSLVFKFQCRTQHYMWCNILAVTSICKGLMFQCRTQHYMWCNSVARSPCPARGERAFWKVVDFLCRFPLMGRHFHRKITASIGVFPCAAQGCAKMENRDGRMRLCGIAVAFSTFLHHVCIIAENP